MKPYWTIAGKENARTLGTLWGLMWLLILCGLLSVFSILLVSDTELSLLDNAQVIYMMSGMILAVGVLLTIILGSDAYAGEKERGTLIPMLCAPVNRTDVLAGKTLGLLMSWGIMYGMAVPYLLAVGAKGQNLGSALIYLAFFGTPVVLGFGYLAMALSARTGSVMTSLLSTVTLLMLAASPLIITPSLRATSVGRAFDTINPFAAALNTFDSVIIDSDPFSAQITRLVSVIVWLVICYTAARRSTAHPDF
jgi:ABC-type transport system involved in multi-copper enzyme maturation permease subunit